MEFETNAIHIGDEPERTLHGDVVSPIHLSTTFAKIGIDDIEKGYVYTRTSNPTRDNLERKLASLEGAGYSLAFSSGSSAQTTFLLAMLKKGDHIVAFDDLYGGTKRIFHEVLGNFGIEVSYVDATKVNEIESALRENTTLVWIESPTNPLMKMADISTIAKICKKKCVKLLVDNTFMSPFYQRPIELGADVVLYSTTKYMCGHSDSLGGALMTNDEKIYKKLAFYQNAIGAVLSPFDSWLVMRGLKTLGLRMERHDKNALEVARWLENHPKVRRVLYPGLKSHPQHSLAVRQMDGFGGMLSFEMEGTLDEARKFVESLEVFALAESLGGVEGLIEIPSLMTHSSVPAKDMKDIPETLIRVSVGIENIKDIIEDMERAFNSFCSIAKLR